MTQFSQKSIAILVIAALILFAGIWYSEVSEARHEQAKQDRIAVANSENQVRQLRTAIEQYETSVERLGWRPGAGIEREPVALSTRFARDEFHLMHEVLRATYEAEESLFAVRSFNITRSAGPSFQMDMAGENVLIFRDSNGSRR